MTHPQPAWQDYVAKISFVSDDGERSGPDTSTRWSALFEDLPRGWRQAAAQVDGSRAAILAHRDRGHQVGVVQTAAGLELRLDLPTLGTETANEFVRGLWMKWNASLGDADGAAASMVLEGLRRDRWSGRVCASMRTELAPPVGEDEVRGSIRQLQAGLFNSIEWVAPVAGTPNYHDVVWAAAAGRIPELVAERARFERHIGEIGDAYWPHHRKVAVAVVTRRRSVWQRLLGLHGQVRLERITGDVRAGEWSQVLRRISTLAVRAHYALSGMSQRTAVQGLYDVAAEVYPRFDVLDDQREPAAARESEIKDVESALDRVQHYIDRAAKREAPIVYVGGMLLGMLALAVLLAAIAIAVRRADPDSIEKGLLFGCVIAGALGAILSVVQRLSAGRIRLDAEVGREYVRLLGGVRPFIGAVFGALLYMALDSGALSSTIVLDGPGRVPLFLALSFVAGFSERFANDMLASIGARREDARPAGDGEADEATAAPRREPDLAPRSKAVEP